MYALRDAIVAAVREGRLPEERLAEAAQRVQDLVGWHAAQAPARQAAAAEPDDDLGLTGRRGGPPRGRRTPARRGPAGRGDRRPPPPGRRQRHPPGVARALAELLPGTQAITVTVGDPCPTWAKTGPSWSSSRTRLATPGSGRSSTARWRPGPTPSWWRPASPGRPSAPDTSPRTATPLASARAPRARLAHRPPYRRKRAPMSGPTAANLVASVRAVLPSLTPRSGRSRG